MPTRPLRILVVDDNPLNQRLVLAILEPRGHSFALAADGAEALAMTARERFDVVLMDVEMAGMDGLRATAAIRAREVDGGPRLRVVAMTASSAGEDRDRCLAAGMDEYLTKPVPYQELIDTVEGTAPDEERSAEAAGDPDRLGDEGDAGMALPRGPLAQLGWLFVADALRSCAEMGAAIAARDGPALRAVAHRLRGVSGFYQSKRIHGLARDLEAAGRAEDFSASTLAAHAELTATVDRLERTMAAAGPSGG
jgi:CheY-like chemotaxis protein/HPt (histidine-containing phosphotransfer) domain-containing protein